MLLLTACHPGAKLTTDEHTDPAAMEQTLLDDASAAGADVWVVYPAQRFGDGYTLWRMTGDAPAGRCGSTGREPVNVTAVTPNDLVSRGSLQDLVQALRDASSPIRALRLPENSGWQQWPSIDRLVRELEAAGWSRVEGRYGLWLR